MRAFESSHDLVQAELKRLDLLIHRQILRLRAVYQLSLDEFRGLYISDEQVDALIDETARNDSCIPRTGELTAKAETLRRENELRCAKDLPWAKLSTEFSLSRFESDVLLLALAPEIYPKYETLYAYLNNDVTRKWPTCDLALTLLSTDTRELPDNRGYLLPGSTLFGEGILQPLPKPQDRSSWLTGGFRMAPGVAHYLLGHGSMEQNLTSVVEHVTPQADWSVVPISTELSSSLKRVAQYLNRDRGVGSRPVLVFEGRYGSGRKTAAEAVCRELGRSMLTVNYDDLRASSEDLPLVMKGLILHQRMIGAGLFITGTSALCDGEGKPREEATSFIKGLTRFRGPVMVSLDRDISWKGLLQGLRCMKFEFSDPDLAGRFEIWNGLSSRFGDGLSEDTLKELSDRFVLTPGQIHDAACEANDMAMVSSNGIPPDELRTKLFFESACAQSDGSLGRLAVKVNAVHRWDDLVLPEATLERVSEVGSAIRNRHLVYSEWGFGKRISYGKGLMVMFSGGSGTGKTMTAGVIAGDLNLELYKVDLSGVVSKYIGETERNLDRIFTAARNSNAILFFDEADALFGKRSEVKDSHDRYANIEISYLLQKMEEHEGAVILASNLSRNIDQAFSRRMHYVVEFPMPGEKHREKLWHGMFNEQVPLGDDIDFSFLAAQFELSGGDIRNVALDAAFLAARNGRVITMRELIKAMSRQMIKQGKIPAYSEFREYYHLIS